MSELFFCYLANSILRGAVVVGLLWLIERCCRRRLICKCPASPIWI